MADGTIDPRELSQAFLQALREFNSGGDRPAVGGGGSGARTETLGPGAANSLKSLISEVTKLTSRIKQGNPAINTYMRLMEGQGVNFRNIDSTLDQLEKSLKDAKKANDLNGQAILRSKRAELEKAAAITNAKVATANFALGTAKALKEQMLPAVSDFVKGLQGDASANSLASGTLTAAIDIAGGAAQSAGGAVAGFGQATMGAKGPIGLLGKAAAVAGPMIESLAGSATKLAKFGVSVLGKEVDRANAAFTAANAAGALYANGMSGVRDAALSAGLTTEQFSKVLQERSSDIADAGLGVSQGAKMIGGALAIGGTTMKRELLNLGYGFEDQAALVAETMSNMRQSGKALTSGDQAAIAQQTSKYAENLRVISAITGEDARKKMAQVKEQAAQLAFQQKLAGMDATQRDNIINAMANMSEQQRKNFMDTMVFGQTINKAGAAMEATSTNFAANNQALVAAAQQGVLDADKTRAINAQFAEGVRQDMLNNKEIGMAGMAGLSGIAGDLSSVMGQELQYRQKWNADAIAAATTDTAGAKQTQDELTAGLMGATTAAQKLKVDIQEVLSPAIKYYGEVTNQVLTGIEKTLADVGLYVKGGSINEQYVGMSQSAQNWEQLSGSDAVVGGINRGMEAITDTANMLTGGLIDYGLSFFGQSLEKLKQERIDYETAYLRGLKEKQAGGMADGGIARGPMSGYAQLLHGNELVIPLTSSGAMDTSSVGFEHALKLLQKTDTTGISSAVSSNVRDPERVSNMGMLSSVASKIGDVFENFSATAIAAQTATAPGVKSSTTNNNRTNNYMMDGEEESPMSRVLSEQLELLKQLTMQMGELNATSRDSLGYQRTIVENTY